MMKLIALRQIRSGCGTIERDQPFVADEALAKHYIDGGLAVPEAKAATLPWTGKGYWRVQPEWLGETVVIVGGGPSLTSGQIDDVVASTTDPKIIAINNALQYVPFADLLYFCDARWYEWHRQAVQDFMGMRVTLENLELQKQLDVRCLRDYGVSGYAPKNDGVTNGRNGGYQALHLAAWLGAARVILLGFDMRAVDGRMHWHEEHRMPTPQTIFPSWIHEFNQLAPLLKMRNVEVINCTPDSALTAFPYQPLHEVLGVTLHEPPLLTDEQELPGRRWDDANANLSASDPGGSPDLSHARRWYDENASMPASYGSPDPEAR